MAAQPGHSAKGAGVKAVLRGSLRWKFAGLLALFTAVVMVFLVLVVRREVSETLQKEIEERGLALARNLAASCVDPMDLPERELALMLLVKDYVQTGGTEAVQRALLEKRTLTQRVLDDLKAYGREQDTSGVRNEGVLLVAVTDSSTMIAAWADAATSSTVWLERMGKPYAPDPQTGLLADGEDSRIWQSPARNGIFVIAVPILKRLAASGEDELGDPFAAPQYMKVGGVYLILTQALVDRKVSLAVARLLMVAVGVMVLGVLLATIIGELLAKPIRMLQQGVNAIAGGNFAQRIRLRRRDEIGELTDSFNDMAKGLEERELMRGAFSTYVSQDLLAEIIKNPEAMKVGGARRMASVLFSFFSDHDKFVADTEKMEPEHVVKLVNAYLEVQARLVSQFSGYLDKFIGEEAMAVFGIPTERPDHAEKAVRCACAIQKAVTELNTARTRQGLITATVSVGVNSGPLVAGNMGSASAKLDYTVIGDTVNTAARLGQNAKGAQVLISESTYALVGHMVTAKELEPMAVKGKAVPLRVFDVSGFKS